MLVVCLSLFLPVVLPWYLVPSSLVFYWIIMMTDDSFIANVLRTFLYSIQSLSLFVKKHEIQIYNYELRVRSQTTVCSRRIWTSYDKNHNSWPTGQIDFCWRDDDVTEVKSTEFKNSQHWISVVHPPGIKEQRTKNKESNPRRNEVLAASLSTPNFFNFQH